MEEYRKQLQKYYNSKYFMSNPDNWQELANQAVARDLAKYQANQEQLYKGDILDEIVVTPKSTSVIKYTPAVETDQDPGYTKFMSGQRYYADQDHKNYLDRQRKDMIDSIRKTTDKVESAMSAGEILKHNLQAIKRAIQRKLGKIQDDKEPEIINLSDQNVERISPTTKNVASILGNDFVEWGNKTPSFREASFFKKNQNKVIPGTRIPINNITTYYGVEDNRLKAGSLNKFQENTIVVPNRSKYIGKVIKVIPPQKYEDPNYNAREQAFEQYNQEHGLNESKFKEFIKYGRAFKGAPSWKTQLRLPYDEFVKVRDSIEMIYPYPELLSTHDPLYITTQGDTIKESDLGIVGPKYLFADEKGNAVFINKLNENNADSLNTILNKTPMYPILIDNGRYQHYNTKNPSYYLYTINDFYRNPKLMYVFGTTTKKRGGKLNYLNLF